MVSNLLLDFVAYVGMGAQHFLRSLTALAQTIFASSTFSSIQCPPPAGVAKVRGEWFVAGTQPGPVALRTARSGLADFGIQNPRDGSVLVLDPDIPMTAQRLVFEGAAGRWLLDGREVGSGSQVNWLPRPGRHVLERRSADAGAVPADRVAFEVRAAPPPLRKKPRPTKR